MDMLVKLYEIQEPTELLEKLDKKGIRIIRALGLDTGKVLAFIKENFHEGWVDECRVSLMSQPSSCYIAVKNKKVIGFCCYDATYRDFVGPMGVDPDERGQGIGQALMYRCLVSMREAGYGYAIIGWAAEKAMPLYERAFQAEKIPGSFPGIYKEMVEGV